MTSQTKSILITAGIGLVVAGAAYGGGRWQGHVQTESVRGELQTTRTSLTSELEQSRSQLGECRARAVRLDARRHLHLALLELTALNFGHATAELEMAAKKLASAAEGNAEVAALARRIEETELEPTSNLDESREKLKQIAQRFDQLVPPL